MKVKDFNRGDWKFDGRCFRHIEDFKLSLTLDEFSSLAAKKESYERDYELLSNFRSECLEFGKYPEYILQEFLNKRYL